MRHNIAAIDEAAGAGALAADSGLAPARVRALIDELGREVERVPAAPRSARWTARWPAPPCGWR